MKSDFAPTKILVVEDEPVIGSLCRRVLSTEGYTVDIAINAKIAQDLININNYNLCLIDIRTPTMNGKQLLNWLEQKQSPLAKRIIFTTGDVLGGDTLSFLQESGKPFLAKPFGPGELTTMVRDTLKSIREEK